MSERLSPEERQQARDRLAALRECVPPRYSGDTLHRVTYWAIRVAAALPAVALALSAASALLDGDPHWGRMAIGVFVFALPSAGVWWWAGRKLAAGVLHDPERTLSVFFRLLARGKERKAAELVVDDDELRADHHAWKEYWRETLGPPQGDDQSTRVEVTEMDLIADDLVVCDVTVTSRTLNRAAKLGGSLLGGGLVGLAVGHAMAHKDSLMVQKVLVRQGEEWRLVSGELESRLDADRSWTRPKKKKKKKPRAQDEATHEASA